MERQQQVVVEGESSDSCIVDSGVPQGTVFLTLTFPVSYQYLTCQSEINSKIVCCLFIKLSEQFKTKFSYKILEIS